MHDGSLTTLPDVLWHYSEADGATTFGASELAPLPLDGRDRDDLVAFLQSLTGTPTADNPLYEPLTPLAPMAAASTACPPSASALVEGAR